MAWWSQCTTLKLMFYPCAAPLHLSSSHLCAETMTVQVACSAWVPWWHLFARLGDNKSSSAKRGRVLCGRSPPGVSRFAPEASPPLCSPRSGHEVLSYSHQTVWLEAPADVTVFVFGFVSSLPLFSLPCFLSALAARALGVWVFKKLKKRGLWKRSWGLGSCTSWIGGFLFSLPLQPKVQSKQSEVNGFIFSCARQFVHNREPLLFVLLTINANIYYPSLSAMTSGFQNLMHSKYFPHFLTKVNNKRNLLNSLYILTNKRIVYIKTLNKVPKICCKCID